MSLESKCLLVSLRAPFLDNDRIYPPLSLLYLKSAAEHEGCHVDVTDDMRNISNLDEYTHVGVSIMTPQRVEANMLLYYINKEHPLIRTIAGGPHVKHYTYDVFHQGWDFIVPEDGERALVNILRGNFNGTIAHDTMSIKELQSMPRPDRTSDQARELLSNYEYTLNGVTATTMMTARGCPGKCCFCEEAGTKVRSTSLDNLNLELDDIAQLGYGGVYLFDDTFTVSLRYTIPRAQLISQHGLLYRCNAQSKSFTQDGDTFAKVLADTGCVEVAFGFESGSQRILDNVHKGTTVEQNYLAVQYAKQHGLKVKGFILLGLPGETEDTLKETEQFVLDSGCDDFQFAVYMPYKGTQIRHKIDVGDRIDIQMVVKEVSGAYGVKGGETRYEVRTKELSPDQIEQFRNHLVGLTKPESHKEKWKDQFFDAHTGVGNG